MSTQTAPQTIADLAPAPYNPRTIATAALDGLKASLEQFGDIAGITFNLRTGHVIMGHQRIRALRRFRRRRRLSGRRRQAHDPDVGGRG